MSLALSIRKLDDNQNLGVDEARATFDEIFLGDPSDDDIATFLLDLAKKGETVDELTGAVQSMRSAAITIKAPTNAMDIVGTGGDQLHTLNISTAVAFVVASCGVPVAKHGNGASTSKSGSSDVLRELGVNLEPDLPVLEQCLNEANLCFLSAPRHHPAMRRVVTIRRKLGVRTIFNLLGPLTNPANVRKHMIGVFELEWLGPMAETLHRLGSESAWIVHGHDGMDEITTTTVSDLVKLKQGMIRHETIDPTQHGIPRVPIDALLGRDAIQNAIEIKRLFRGIMSPYRDIVCMNAAAALVVAGEAEDLHKGLARAAHALDTGEAYNTLDKVVRLTNKVTL